MPASFKIPSYMRAIVLHVFDQIESLVVEERPVPRPQAGQVLIRMHAAPINPSDLAFLRGLYKVDKVPPIVPGFEGSGTIVASGGGMLGRVLLGKRVACAAPNDGDGTWAEYMVTPAQNCLPLRRALTLEQGAMLIVNPLTAWSLMEVAKREGHRAIVQTAAASALGKMIVRLGKQRGVRTINLVRREEQAATLRALDADYVLNSADADFEARLFEVCRRESVRLAFDAVAGELAAQVLTAMPEGGRLVFYGALSQHPSMIDPRAFIFEDKRIEGFWLGRTMRRLSLPQRMNMVRHVQQALAQELQTEIQARAPLEEAAKALRQYAQNMSAGKVLLVLESVAAK